jgi:hypothetical protein
LLNADILEVEFSSDLRLYDAQVGQLTITSAVGPQNAGLVYVQNDRDLELIVNSDDTYSYFNVATTGNLLVPYSPSYSLLSSGDVFLTAFDGGLLDVDANIVAGGDLFLQAGWLEIGSASQPTSLTTAGTLVTSANVGTNEINGTIIDAASMRMFGNTELVLGGAGGLLDVTVTNDASIIANQNIYSQVSLGAGTVDAGGLVLGVGSGFVDISPLNIIAHNVPIVGYSDPGMLQILADDLGVIPSPGIEASLVLSAPELTVGGVDFFGDYISLRSDLLTLSQPINTWLPGSESSPTVNPDVVVHFTPHGGLSRPMGIEQTMPSSPVPGVTYFTQSDHFGRFPGTSLLLGGSNYAGDVVIGQNGIVDISPNPGDAKNFLALTSGTVTGAGNIVTSPPGLISVIGGTPTSPSPSPTTSSSTTTTTTTSPTTTTSTGFVTTFVQQSAPSDLTDPTDTGASTLTEESVSMNLQVEEVVTDTSSSEVVMTGTVPSEEETAGGIATGDAPTTDDALLAGTVPSEEETAGGTATGDELTTHDLAGTQLSEGETAGGMATGDEPTTDDLAGNQSSEEETASATATGDEPSAGPVSDEPIDLVAALEQQPLIDTQIEINGITLACQ